MSIRDVVFVLIGCITAVAAIVSVTSRNVLHAALWLVVTLGALAACYLVMGAELVALVQLLVYVGGVVVLVLFALMLTRAGADAAPLSTPTGTRVLAAMLAALVTVVLGAALSMMVGWTRVDIAPATSAEIGTQIFGTWVWPFELLSLLLLLALIAAIAVARGAGTTEDQGASTDTDRAARDVDAL
ncbi:MAG: NADH-quinone oxidoreductase subunit J [Ornithinimicrobium sp.]